MNNTFNSPYHAVHIFKKRGSIVYSGDKLVIRIALPRWSPIEDHAYDYLCAQNLVGGWSSEQKTHKEILIK